MSTPEDVDFGSMSTQTQGDATTATFTVTWKGIPDDVTTVRATVAAPGQLAQKGTEQNVKGSASHTFEGIPVRPGSDVRVSTQGFDKDDQPIGDKVTHTYPDVR